MIKNNIDKEVPETPAVSRELIAYLRYLYPDKAPRAVMNSFELGESSGVQNLIDHLGMIMMSK